MLAEIEQRVLEQEEARDKGQLELFGALLSDLAERRQYDRTEHSIQMSDGSEYMGTWDRIVHDMREASRHSGWTVAPGVHDERGPSRLLAHGRKDSHERRREFHSRQRARRAASHRSVSSARDLAAPAVRGAARASALLDPATVRRLTLRNGLTVLLHRDETAPVVAIVTHVKAGYFDESDDVVGIAHVLEHMFFKGTSHRPVGAISKETKAAGGYLKPAYYLARPAALWLAAFSPQSASASEPEPEPRLEDRGSCIGEARAGCGLA